MGGKNKATSTLTSHRPLYLQNTNKNSLQDEKNKY